jgi:hypothetical protein
MHGRKKKILSAEELAGEAEKVQKANHLFTKVLTAKRSNAAAKGSNTKRESVAQERESVGQTGESVGQRGSSSNSTTDTAPAHNDTGNHSGGELLDQKVVNQKLPDQRQTNPKDHLSAETVLEVTFKALRFNPEFATFWNYRREVFPRRRIIGREGENDVLKEENGKKGNVKEKAIKEEARASTEGVTPGASTANADSVQSVHTGSAEEAAGNKSAAEVVGTDVLGLDKKSEDYSKEGSEELDVTALHEELALLNQALKQAPKAYCLWWHRRWVRNLFENSLWWHRRWVRNLFEKIRGFFVFQKISRKLALILSINN